MAFFTFSYFVTAEILYHQLFSCANKKIWPRWGCPWRKWPLSGKVVKLWGLKRAWESLSKNYGVGCVICVKTAGLCEFDDALAY